MVDFFFVGVQLGGLLLKLFQLLVQLDALGGGGLLQALFQLLDGGAVAGLLLVDIVGADAGDGVRLVAVQVNQALEAVFLPAVKLPVDGTLLVDFAVIGKEIVEEVAADDLFGVAFSAEGIGDEPEVFGQRGRAVDGLHKAEETGSEVVLKILIVADGDDVVPVGGEGLVVAGIPDAAREGEARHVQRVPAEHTAHGVGEEGADVPAKVSPADGDVLVLHLRGQLVLQAVDVDEDAVEFLLIGFQLAETGVALLLPQPERLCNGGHRPHQRMPLEIPGSFKGVPVSAGKIYC